MLYLLLAQLTDDGLSAYREDPDLFANTCEGIEIDGVRLLARYATLGSYDFVAMAEAQDPEKVTELSIELGAKARVHVQSLLAVSAHLMAVPTDESVLDATAKT